MIIAVDGPSASGKGSLARGLAQELNCYYLDTGSLYRAIGVIASRQFSREQVDDGRGLNAAVVASWVRDLRYSYDERGAVLHHKDENITELLRTPQTDWFASQVSKLLAVRDGICEMQRAVAREHGVVADGRDCGTHIFPNADCKIFLTASLAVRAQRAAGDEARKGESPQGAVFPDKKMSVIPDEDPGSSIRRDIMLRDLRDMTRPLRPLQPANDAIILDVTKLSKEQVRALALSYVR
ncbi:MAG: (d)CMP kinase [Candidatus Dependentiae bacterium]|jgi:cytidylate kinase